ncbi:MAG TPA: DUF2461 domain-containing protein [Acidobacteriaceae bacterium]
MATHFSPNALKFLRGLKRNNDRIWFAERKPIYEAEIKAPMLAIIAELNEQILSFAPLHVRPPQKVAMRIYRDIRFSPDKRPYKRNASAWWSRDGLEKTSGGGYYFHIGPEGLVIAAGVYMPEREQLLAIRRHIAEHHAELRRLLAARKLRSLMSEFEGSPLTRAPKGYLPDHPAIDLLLPRQWGFSATLPVETATTPALQKEIIARFKAAAPVVDFLNTPLAAALRKRPLF